MRNIKFRAWTGIRVPMLNFIQNTMSLVADSDFEVVGNIYEHPDLLEDKYE